MDWGKFTRGFLTRPDISSRHMKVTAKCHNYTGCVLAYRGDNIELDSGAALVCPECGKAVVLAKAANSWMKTTLLLSLVVVVLGGVLAIFLVPKMRGGGSDKVEPPATQGETPPIVPPKKDPPKTDTPKIEIPVRRAEPAEPPPKAVAPPKIEGDVSRPENKSVKAEVLTRIDLMPNIPQSSKDKLYRSVESARSMAKILTIPFSSGGTSPSASDVELPIATGCVMFATLHLVFITMFTLSARAWEMAMFFLSSPFESA